MVTVNAKSKTQANRDFQRLGIARTAQRECDRALAMLDKHEKTRDREICALAADGFPQTAIARQLGLSRQRVSQIVNA